MDEWKGYDNALMELGHNWTNNMCCYVMIGWFFAEQEGMILIGLVAEENFETSFYIYFYCFL